MNQNKIDSLYTLIKQKSQEKGRPLKIICDWDECLFPYRPYAIHKFGQKHGLWLDISFEDFFKTFWEKVTIVNWRGDASNSKEIEYVGEKEKEKLLVKDFMRLKNLREERKKGSDKYSEIDSLDNTPLLSLNDDLLLALKNDLINNLVIISSTYAKENKTSANEKFKREEFAKTFENFLQCNLEMIRLCKIDGQNKPHHSEWIKENHPDFDIFIDDGHAWITSTRKLFGSEKTYIMLDYKSNCHVQEDNVYHLKTTISNLKYQDFAKAAEEYKNNISKKEKKFDGKSIWSWIAGVTLILGFIIAMIYVTKRIKKKK